MVDVSPATCWPDGSQEGEEEGGEWWTLLPAPKTGEQPKSEADGIRVRGAVVDSEAEGGAMVDSEAE